MILTVLKYDGKNSINHPGMDMSRTDGNDTGEERGDPRREAKVSQTINLEIHSLGEPSLRGCDQPALLHLLQTRLMAGR